MKEVLIWQSIDMYSNEELEEYKNNYKSMREADGEEPIAEDELYNIVAEDNDFSWECEKDNFDIPSNKIVNFAHCGGWQGFRERCFQIGDNVNRILYSPMTCPSSLKLYADRYDIRGLEYHHDSRFAGGGNQYLFREIKDKFVGREDEVLPRCLDENGELDMKKVKYYTKSLRPYVKRVYGR